MDGSSSSHQLVIVALPEENDRIQKLSSEKVPHLTLLYLGDNTFNSSELQHITEYVEHASSLIPNFFLEVERRGILGPDKADVLFFYKDDSTREVDNFRNTLLRDPLILSAYNSVEQFPEWIPHLTMGYPDSPAKSDDSSGNPLEITFVRFNRIAVWTGDYEGPTFQLKSQRPEMSMSQLETGLLAVNDFLKHYGVKGMKWGVRHNPSSGGTSTHDSPDTKTLDSHKARVAAGGTRALNTNELQALVTRMNLEQQYSKLSAQQNEIDRGHAQAKRILALGQTVSNAYNLANSPGGKALQKQIKSAVDKARKVHRVTNSPAGKVVRKLAIGV